MVYNEELKREIPEGWEAGTLGNLIELHYGKGLKKEIRSGTGYPVVGSGGIVGYHRNALVHGPGIVIGRKGTVGNITYLDENFYPIDTTYFVQPKIKIKYSFLFFLLNRQRLATMNSDSAVPGLNRDRALGISIILPPIDLIKNYEQISEIIFNKMKKNRKQNQKLVELRDWLLPMLMNGQVTVKEAEKKVQMYSVTES